jgi:integrase
LLRRLQTEEDRKRAVGVSRQDEERQRPLTELVAEYETYLKAKANTPRHVALTLRRLRLLLDATKTKTLPDLDAGPIASTLAVWRSRKRKPLSPSTSNHYAQSVRGFSRWLYVERKTADDPLRSLRPLNARVDRRRVRRALTPDELRRLVHATETSLKTIRGKTWMFTPTDRAMLYTLAVYTGLRVSELASLTPESFDLGTGNVSVSACYSKRRRNDTLPLHSSLVSRLRPWLASKRAGLLFPGTWTIHYKASKILRHDLRAAEIDYVDATGRVLDFHALRHTFITSLARSGVHPLKAKELARHSTITLTMDVYSHVETEELRTALETLPAL